MIENYPPGDPGLLEQELEDWYGEKDENNEEIEEDMGRHWNHHYN